MNPLPLIKKSLNLKRWLVLYTRSNYEKKAAKFINDSGLTAYCPLISTRRKWADRYQTIEQPLFSSYIFVNISVYEEDKVLQAPGIVKFIQHCGRFVEISEQEIQRIKTITSAYSDVRVVSYASLNIGDKVRINDGIFADYEGHITQVTGTKILMVIEHLDCALVVNADKVSVDSSTSITMLS